MGIYEFKDTVQGRQGYDRLMRGIVDLCGLQLTEWELVSGHISPDYIAIVTETHITPEFRAVFKIEKPCFSDPSRHYIRYALHESAVR